MHSANLASSPRLKRVHALLSDGREYSTRDIMHRADVCAVSSVVAELRCNGIGVSCRLVVSPSGDRTFLYQMHSRGVAA